jgi:hypothetical protein
MLPYSDGIREGWRARREGAPLMGEQLEKQGGRVPSSRDFAQGPGGRAALRGNLVTTFRVSSFSKGGVIMGAVVRPELSIGQALQELQRREERREAMAEISILRDAIRDEVLAYRREHDRWPTLVRVYSGYLALMAELHPNALQAMDGRYRFCGVPVQSDSTIEAVAFVIE